MSSFPEMNEQMLPFGLESPPNPLILKTLYFAIPGAKNDGRMNRPVP